MSPENPPDISIVIVHYRTEGALGVCLKSLYFGLNAGGLHHEVCVVDNGSDSEEIAALKRNFSRVQWIGNPINEGFAKACNQGLRLARGKYCLLLNPDCQVSLQTIPRMLRHMEQDTSIGIAGPRHRYPDGRLQPTCRQFPTLWNVFTEQLLLNKLFPHSPRLNAYKMGGFAHDTIREVDQLMGSCLFLRRSLLDQIGFLDERFFMYFEEVDICRRAKQAGLKIMFFPDTQAEVIHSGGASSDQDIASRVAQRYRSLHLLHRKWSSPLHVLLLKILLLKGLLLRIIVFGCLGKKDLCRAYAKALQQWPSW